MHRWGVLLMALGIGLLSQYRPAFGSENRDFVQEHSTAETPFILKSAADAVGKQLRAFDRDLAEAARQLANLNLKRDAARTVLRELQARHAESVIDASTISPKGVMLTVEPSRYRAFEGKDINDQEQIKILLRTRQPVLSRLFRTVEGMEAVDLEHPIIGSDGTYRGSVSIIFQPWVVIGNCVRNLVAGMPVEIWAMQPDGRIIYDVNPQEVGRILFTDPSYQSFPELLHLGRQIAAEPEGHGSYSYFKAGSSQVIRKDAWWLSLNLHGMAWRLVSIHPAEAAGPALSDNAGAFSFQALQSLAHEPALIQALAQGKRENALKIFRQAAISHTGVYSLSWVDAKAVNCFGYPSQNSLFRVDLHTQTDVASIAIVGAIEQHKALDYIGPLVEGGRARYVLMPVMDGRKYLGSLLWIHKED